MQSGRAVIGRDTSCQIRVPLPEVSRQHCEIIAAGDAVAVRDLDSSNGVYVNRERVKEARLGPGDAIAVGPVTFVLRVDGEPRAIDPRDYPAPAGSAEDSSLLSGDELRAVGGNNDDSSVMDFDFDFEDDDDEQPAL